MIDQWIEVFKGGPQTSQDGTIVDGDQYINRALKTFDPSEHEPPAVIGHPAVDAPAYGWVYDLKKEEKPEGAYLMAKFKDIEPAFAEIVKAGRYKKRSASFYPDGRLKHVGFLGAVPPAVKGLKNISFGDEPEDITFTFSDKEDNMSKTFSEADLAAAVKEAEVKARKEVSVQFAEEQKTAVETARQEAIEKTKQEMTLQFAEDQKAKALEAAFPKDKIGDLAKQAKTFAKGLDNITSVKFADGEEDTQFGWFINFMKKKGQQDHSVLFSEYQSEDLPQTPDELDKAIQAYAKAHKVEYSVAFNEMQKDSPELFVMG
jgi:hypothetical protein